MKENTIKPTKFGKIFESDKSYRKPDNMILDLAMTYIHVTRMIYDSKLEDWRSPFIVNASFAIELYLKSMQKGTKTYGPPFEISFGSEQNPPRKKQMMLHSKSEISYKGDGHNLLNLFAQIPERNRDYLLHIFSQPGHDIDFEDFLKEHKKAFISWRYCYEGKTETFSAKKVLNVLRIIEGYRMSLNILDQEIPHYEV
ncbi:MAG: hypothetical protein K9K37_08425 [Desulfocapsa sp.]|nr:hypothetical protein [Desulfocapsa sp.]